MSDPALPILFTIDATGVLSEPDGRARAIIADLPPSRRGPVDRLFQTCRAAPDEATRSLLIETRDESRWHLSARRDPTGDDESGEGGARLIGVLVPAEGAARVAEVDGEVSAGDGKPFRGRTAFTGSRDQERLMVAALDNTATAVAIFDRAADHLIYTNQAFETLFGTGPGDRPWTENVVDWNEPGARVLAESTKANRPFTAMMTVRNPRTGRVFPASFTVDVVKDWETGQPRYFFGTGTDRSEECERLRGLRDAITDERRAHSGKIDFIRAISHDLRQPVFALGLLAEAAKPILEREKPEIANALWQSVEGLRRMLESLFEMGALGARRLTPKPETVSFDRLFRQATTEIALRAKQRGIDLRIGTADAALRSDPVLIGRMLRNLLTNAVEHAHASSITLAAWRTADGVRFSVSDDGIGVPADSRERIFAEFVQLHQKPRAKDMPEGGGLGQGLGLGLSIVAGIADLLGGSVALRAPEEGGACFVVTLPDLSTESAADTVDGAHI
ncbi:HAMP domain-containing histidine kinase [Marivibrio halodurans]|uniref:histidine kinase n=1 Tax=Marivibrio halodurans TaxID=2039722 RepID=A0A8J7SKX7_9PROT|nr:HAMP domain-containing sensor histidine kinase [Marivibrio halodurans]MBP5858758.1 HAMP domain-containing histidine kinase [Marivibrio halodurans]